MRFEFSVDVDIERVEGKFVSRDELREIVSDALSEALDGLDLDGLGADGTSTYEVVESNVDEIEQTKTKR